jgi:hypothetical protein
MSPRASVRAFWTLTALVAIVLCVVTVDTVIVFRNRDDVNRFTALYGQGRQQAALIDKVDRLSCQRTIVTRSGLVTFFDAAARDRMAAERQEPDSRAALLDAKLVKADLLAAKQERSAGCDGTFPDGGSG